jgi:hypothetical protein
MPDTIKILEERDDVHMVKNHSRWNAEAEVRI